MDLRAGSMRNNHDAKPMTSNSIYAQLVKTGDAWSTAYGPFVLRSALQPIFRRVADGLFDIHSFQGLVRAERAAARDVAVRQAVAVLMLDDAHVHRAVAVGPLEAPLGMGALDGVDARERGVGAGGRPLPGE